MKHCALALHDKDIVKEVFAKITTPDSRYNQGKSVAGGLHDFSD
jgi:hypothetical protein